MFAVSRRCLMLVILIAMLAGCGTSTSQPTPTVVPTEPPTSTPVPPTATPLPTNTPIPPTNTPAPTNTPIPTATPLPTNTPKPAPTKAVTPKPTNTKSAAAPVSTGGGVSSNPSTLQTSIDQSFNAAQGVVSLLNQMSSGGGVELCIPLIQKYQSIHNAPTYDVSGQSNEMQQAYGAYRNGISLLDTRATLIVGCGQGGGSIGRLELGSVHSTATQAADSFAQAQNVLKQFLDMSTMSPLENAIVRALHAIGGVGDAANKMMPNKFWGPNNRRIAATDSRCVEAITSHNAIPSFTMDTTGQPASVQTAYQLYQEALNLYQVDVSNFPKSCVAGEVTVSPVGMSALHDNIVNILDKLTEAQNALK